MGKRRKKDSGEEKNEGEMGKVGRNGNDRLENEMRGAREVKSKRQGERGTNYRGENKEMLGGMDSKRYRKVRIGQRTKAEEMKQIKYKEKERKEIYRKARMANGGKKCKGQKEWSKR